MLKLERCILFQKNPLTYPISNTRARNLCFLFSDDECEKRMVNIFVGGCNDVNHVLETISKRSSSSRICFEVNDIENYISSRVFLLMVLMLIEKDIDFVYQVRCSQFLTQEHHKKLLKYLKWVIARLEEDRKSFCQFAFTKYNFLKLRFSFVSKDSLDRIIGTMKFWLHFHKPKEEVVKIRNKYINDYINLRFQDGKRSDNDSYPQVLMAMAMNRISPTENITLWERKTKEYFRTGVYLRLNRKQEDHKHPNPTFFDPDSGYSSHPTTNIYESFHEDEKMDAFRNFKKLVRKFRKNKVAHYRFSLGDILKLLRTTNRKYDFIYTSNIADNLGVINLILSSQRCLRNDHSVIEVESMKMGRMKGVSRISVYDFYHYLLPFNPKHIPLLFKLVCVSEVYEKDEVTSISNIRETSSSCRLYFQSEEEYPFSSTSNVNMLHPLHTYNRFEFDFFISSEGDNLLKELINFLYIILKYKGVGISHENVFGKNMDGNKTTIPLTPALTLTSFFLILNNLNLSESSKRSFSELLLLRPEKMWEERMKMYFCEDLEEMRKLLEVYCIEMEIQILYHWGSKYSGISTSIENDRILFFEMKFEMGRKSYLVLSPPLSLCFMKSKKKLTVFDLIENRGVVVFPMLESRYKLLNLFQEYVVLVDEHSFGEDLKDFYSFCSNQNKQMIGDYSLPMDLGKCKLLDLQSPGPVVPKKEEEEEIIEEEDGIITWRMDDTQLVAKVFVGEDLINEVPKFVENLAENRIIISYPMKKKFEVKYNFNNMFLKKGVSTIKPKYQRSKKRKMIIIRIRTTTEVVGDRFSSLVEEFSERIVLNNRTVFEELKDWDLTQNEVVQKKLSRVMFSMKEILFSKTNENTFVNDNPLSKDHALRVNLLYVMTHFLLSLNTCNIIIQDKEQNSGLVMCGVGTKKLGDRSGLPIFEVYYCYKEREKMKTKEHDSINVIVRRFLEIEKKQEEEVQRKFPTLVSNFNRAAKNDPLRGEVHAGSSATIWAPKVEQEKILKFLDENQKKYLFQSPNIISNIKSVRRSVLFPLLSTNRGPSELMDKDFRERIGEFSKNFDFKGRKKR